MGPQFFVYYQLSRGKGKVRNTIFLVRYTCVDKYVDGSVEPVQGKTDWKTPIFDGTPGTIDS